MAEVIAGLGLAGTIVQLIDFSSKIISRLNEFTSQTTDVPDTFRSIAAQLPLFVLTLRQVETQSRAGRIGDDVVNALDPVIARSLEHAQSLNAILDKVEPQENSSSLEKKLKALKSLSYDKKVQKAVNEIQSNIQLFIFHQATSHIDTSESIFQQLSKLSITPPPVPQFCFGLNIASAPQIDEGNFVGRDVELAQLEEWLLPQTDPPLQNIVSVVGLGGLGKTQLSIMFARNNQSLYSSIFWIDARDEIALRGGLVAVCCIVFNRSASSVVNNLDEEESRIQQIRRWLSEQGNDRWLLLFDNYDDPKFPGVKSSTGYDIRRYFPHRSQGSILITTRSTRLTFGKQLMLSKLSDLEQSLAILATRSGRDIKNGNFPFNATHKMLISVWTDSEARKLAQRLDGLPLALTTAGMYLRQTSESFGGYLDAYENEWLGLRDDAQELLEYEDRTLFSTWNLSLSLVRAQDPDAAELMHLLAYFGSQDISYKLLRGAATDALPWLQRLTENKRRFDRAMSRLHDFSLVEISTGSYSLHACVHDWALQESNHHTNVLCSKAVLHAVASNVAKEDERDYWLSNRLLLGHAKSRELGRFLERLDDGDVDEKLADDMALLGLFWNLQGDDRAGQIYRRALAGKERALGPDHISTLDTVNELGLLYREQGKLGEAEKMFQRALAGYKKALGPDHTSTLHPVNNLGLLYWDQGKLGEAVKMYQRALAGYEKAVRPDHKWIFTTVNNLGRLYRDQGKLDEAEQMYQRALAGKERALGPDHTLTLGTVNDLGLLYRDQGKLGEAEQMFQRALAGYKKALGPDHISTLHPVNNLGLLYRDQGKLGEAEKMYQQALTGYEKAVRPDHKWILTTVNNLGRLYRDQDKLDEAEQMYQRALAGKERALGPDHISTLNTVNNLGLLYKDQGKLGEAEKMYLRALAGCERALGPDHVSTLDTVNNLGLLYRDQGRLDEAEQMFQRASAGRKSPGS